MVHLTIPKIDNMVLGCASWTKPVRRTDGDVYIKRGGDGEAIAIVRVHPCPRPIAPKNQTSYVVTRNEGERGRYGGEVDRRRHTQQHACPIFLSMPTRTQEQG